MSTRALLLCVAAAAAVSTFFWDTLPIYPFRLLVTLMHESGHALATILLGGTVQSVTISPREGGLTLSAYDRTLLPSMIITSAGYVGSAISGAALLWAAGRMRSGRFILGLLVVWMLAVAFAWVRPSHPPPGSAAALASGYAGTDWLFTLAFTLGTSAAMFLIAWKGTLWLRRVFIVWVATLSCLAALQDIKGLFGYGLGGSDADAMAQITHLPAALWAGLWMLLSVFAILLGVRSILVRRQPVPRVPVTRPVAA